MNLGFVGLGAMGLPMTRHLLEAGHQVTVASRSPGRWTGPCPSAPWTAPTRPAWPRPARW